MLELKNIKTVYLLGIGGIGMSALARYFNANGKKVSGYDKTPTLLTEELVSEGIEVHFDDDIKYFKSLNTSKEEVLIIYTPAIPKDHQEFNWLKDNGYNLLKRSEVLGLLTKESFTIAVAGTHGKTTTSSIIAHLFKSAGVEITAFLGGISKNYDSNLLLSKANEGGQNIVVVEADEYDRSFLTLHPDTAVITSMDADHLDIYGDKTYMEESYKLFSEQVKEGGKLIVKEGLPLNHYSSNYSLKNSATFKAENIRIIHHKYVFDVITPLGELKDLTLGLPGLHNVENAVAAVAVAQSFGINPKLIHEGLVSYTGVYRRFDYQVNKSGVVYIDDYAHHPEELKACINSVAEMYPGKRICGIFQPHLFTRTRDFVDGFAESLELLDIPLLLDIYPAREKPIPGITSEIITEKMKSQPGRIIKKENWQKELEKEKFDVLLTLGAGDIDQLVIPIKEWLIKNKV